MSDQDLHGKLVFLTVHVDRWLREVNPKFEVPMANRLAKVIKVVDWDSEEGKLLEQERKKIGKWKTLKSEDFKYVLKVYHPDLIIKDKRGITVHEVLPRFYPDTKLLMFDVLPEWMLEDFEKEEKDPFTLKKKRAPRKAKTAKCT